MTQIIVAIIALVGVIVGALFGNWDKLFPPDQPPDQPVPSRSVPVPPSSIPTPPRAEPPAVTTPDRSGEAVAAMQWIESRCGPGIRFVVPSPPGSTIDMAARSFATALGNSGVKPIPVIVNMASVFSAGGRFSVEKFDVWQRSHGSKEGCLLAIVPDYARNQFSRPRFNATIRDRSYGIVLPRGILSEAAGRWNTVFVKADKDPDFVREIGRSDLKVNLISIE